MTDHGAIGGGRMLGGKLGGEWGTVEGGLERESELARITDLLGGAHAGRGGLGLIAGPAGIGKTTLLRAAARHARDLGTTVLVARGAELEREFSFGVARQLFEPLLAVGGEQSSLLEGAARRALLALGEEVTGAPTSSDRAFAVVHGLYWLTVNTSRRGPLLVAVDDLQWADAPSQHWLVYLAERLEGLPATVLASWRTGDPTAGGEAISRLEGVHGAVSMVLAPLSREGVGALLAGAFGPAASERLTEPCLRATGGNPFLVRELIGAIRAEGIAPDESAPDQVLGLAPRSVARSVAMRVGRLGAVAAELARATAILGDGSLLRHAAELAGAPLDEAARAADGLAAMQILEPGLPLRFVHGIVRASVYDDMPAAMRSLWHGRAARLLAAEHADPELVCPHLMMSESAGSLDAVAQLRSAAGRALDRGAPETAARYLARAVSEARDAEFSAQLLYDLAGAERLTGSALALDHVQAALSLATDPVERMWMALTLSELQLIGGDWKASLETVEAALAEVGPDRAGSDGGVEALDRLEAYWLGMTVNDPKLVTEHADRLETLRARARRRPGESTWLSIVLGTNHAMRGAARDEVSALLDVGIADGTWLEDDSVPAWLPAQAFMGLMHLDELDRSQSLVDQLFELSRRRGSPSELVLAHWFRAWTRVRRGDLVGGETDLRAVFELAPAYNLTSAIPATLFLSIDSVIERTELADLIPMITGIELDPIFERTINGAFLRSATGRLALARRDTATALRHLTSCAETFEALGTISPNAPPWRSDLALATGTVDEVRALAMAHDALEHAEALGFARAIGVALRTQGILKGARRGIGDLADAVSVLEGSDARLEHARALVEYGAALRRSNQRQASREPLRAGLDLAHRCGATRLADRATTELRATGAKPRRMLVSGLEALTPSERRVAELAAGGMSNPEIAQALFVTLNTVQGHLRHVYQKLSIRSRTDLPAALRSTAPSNDEGQSKP